jgi:hypothetical protein
MNDDIKVESITDHEDGSATVTLQHVRSRRTIRYLSMVS